VNGKNNIKIDLPKMKCEEVDYIQTRNCPPNVVIKTHSYCKACKAYRDTNIKIIAYLSLITKAVKR
jgi:hypothetical protein